MKKPVNRFLSPKTRVLYEKMPKTRGKSRFSGSTVFSLAQKPTNCPTPIRNISTIRFQFQPCLASPPTLSAEEEKGLSIIRKKEVDRACPIRAKLAQCAWFGMIEYGSASRISRGTWAHHFLLHGDPYKIIITFLTTQFRIGVRSYSVLEVQPANGKRSTRF